MPRHYHFNDKTFYEVILNHTSYDHIWLFQAPECPTRLGDNPSKDGLVAGVVRLLTTRYNATRWPSLPDESDDSVLLLHDLSGLAQSKKIILPVSSWAFWAGIMFSCMNMKSVSVILTLNISTGIFSNATEIHVNAPPHHLVMHGMPHYYYHNEKTREYFGKLNESMNDIIYDIELDSAGHTIRDTSSRSNPKMNRSSNDYHSPNQVNTAERQSIQAINDSNSSLKSDVLIVSEIVNDLKINTGTISAVSQANVTVRIHRDSHGGIDVNITSNDPSSSISTTNIITTDNHKNMTTFKGYSYSVKLP